MSIRGTKYGNIHTRVGTKTFHSKLEAARYEELLLMEKAGEIRDLQCQVMFRLEINSVLVGKYYADFVYETKNGKQVVEDVKGFMTDTYVMKKRLMDAIYGIKILETTAKTIRRRNRNRQ